MKHPGIEYMDAQPLQFAQAEQPARPTKAEADQVVNILVQAYAAKYKVSYPEAFSAIRTKAPRFFAGWMAIRNKTGE